MNDRSIGECSIDRPPSDHPNRRAEVRSGRLTLLNQTKPFNPATPEALVFSEHKDRLWQVRFHTHEWLLDVLKEREPPSDDDFVLIAETIDNWCRAFSHQQSEPRGLAWNSYVVATRMRSWCLVYQQLDKTQQAQLGNAMAAQLTRHATHLMRNIEWDLRANHLLRDAVGLAFASQFVDHSNADTWSELAKSLTRSQASEQVLADGGHFERSPMYHAEALADFLELRALFHTDDTVRNKLSETISSMKNFLSWCCHPDGKVALLNDGAFNGMPRADWLWRTEGDKHEHPVPRGDRLFADFGLFAIHENDWSILLDVGPVGVDYQPGHAHADTLTLEASCRGERVIVDPGTYAYDRDEKRSLDRSTQSHNSIEIDGSDSSEVWDIFRVGRRACPRVVAYSSTDKCIQLTASHDGYRHLPGRPEHQRRLEFDRKNEFLIEDTITGEGNHSLVGGLLIAPDWRVDTLGPGTWRLTSANSAIDIVTQGKGLRFDTQLHMYHPEYGMEIETTRLIWSYAGELPYQIMTRVIRRSET